jgi:hypothetical protein
MLGNPRLFANLKASDLIRRATSTAASSGWSWSGTAKYCPGHVRSFLTRAAELSA